MPHSCEISSLWPEPIVECLLRAECHYDGWTLWVRHRHHGGGFADCAPHEYGPLTLDELQDVLGATVDTWCVPPGLDRA